MLNRLTRYSDLIAPVGVVIVVLMMVVPLPTALISLLIAANISFALLVLLAALNVLEPLKLSAFPSLLLVATLFRLAINISVTRLVLLHHNAGGVIEAFGRFVVGGNLVVGLVVFLILSVIQFVVITNGAGRVAEVAARFTLDALPGKQMAIDVRVNAGQLSDAEADKERKKLQREADFYGAMDGASKFVRGDAIAAVIIVTINLIGGIVIGMMMQHMPVRDAMHTYSLLTVGDGLSAMIPALLFSTATGIIVTRSASDTHLGQELVEQLAGAPKPLFIVAGALTLIGIVPGMPKLPFFALALLVGGAGYLARRGQQESLAEDERKREEERLKELQTPPDVRPQLTPDMIELAVGYALVPLVDASEGSLSKRVRMIRRNIAQEIGFVVSPVRIRDNPDLGADQYAIKIRGETVAEGRVQPGYLMALNPLGGPIEVPGIDTTEPTWGLPAKFIPAEEEARALALNYTVVDPVSQITTHLSQVIRDHAADLLSRESVKEMLDDLKETHPATVEEMLKDRLSLGQVHRVLQMLLAEGVPIRDLVTICETLADLAPQTQDIAILAEGIRHALRLAIVGPLLAPDRTLSALVLSPSLDQEIGSSIQQTAYGQQLTLAPDRIQATMNAIADAVRQSPPVSGSLVILCSVLVRRQLRELVEQVAPRIPVLAYPEVPTELTVHTVGVINVPAGEPAVV